MNNKDLIEEAVESIVDIAKTISPNGTIHVSSAGISKETKAFVALFSAIAVVWGVLYSVFLPVIIGMIFGFFNGYSIGKERSEFIIDINKKQGKL